MTTEQKYNEVRQAIIKAVPELVKRNYWHCPKHGDLGSSLNAEEMTCRELATLEQETREIRLSDVLRAVDHSEVSLTPYSFAVLPDGSFYSLKESMVFTDGRIARNLQDAREMRIGWNLTQDDLSLQSEETVAFLHSILCV